MPGCFQDCKAIYRNQVNLDCKGLSCGGILSHSLEQGLGTNVAEVESIMMSLILDGKMSAKIDQCTNTLVIDRV